MASEMVIESEVFGCCVEEIYVLIEISIEGIGFAAPQVSGICWLAVRRPKQGSESAQSCQVSDVIFRRIVR